MILDRGILGGVNPKTDRIDENMQVLAFYGVAKAMMEPSTLCFHCSQEKSPPEGCDSSLNQTRAVDRQ